MIKGVRDKETLAGLGLSRRLTVRLGVLLGRGLAFTEALLESAVRGSTTERLLMSDALLEEAATVQDEGLTRHASSAGVPEKLALVDTPEGRVVALQEEVEADRAWQGPEEPGGASLVKLARAPALAQAGTGEAARSELFSRAEIDRLKLTALTSARTDEAVSALRQLAYAPVPAGERGEVFVRALACPEPPVRAEAARLLASVGLAPEISEALASLAAGGESEKLLAIDRLGPAMAAGHQGTEGDLALVSTLVALTSALAGEQSARVRGHVLSSLAGAAAVLATFPERLAEVLRHLVELLVADYSATQAGALDLLNALRDAAAEQIDGLLRNELGKTRAPRVRALLLAQLSAIARFKGGEAAAEVAGMLAEEAATGAQEAGDQQTLCGELFQMPAPLAAQAIMENFSRARPAIQRQFLRLLADMSRYRQMDAKDIERAGELFLHCLEGATKELRLGVLETILPADPRLSDDLRARLAAAYLERFGDLVFRADIDLAENTVARMGPAALPALLERLGPTWPGTDRVRAARVIGEMGRLVADGQIQRPEAAARLRDAERDLLRVSASDFPDSGVLAVAMAKLAAALDEDQAALQAVWHRVEAMQMAEAARLDALSWLTASRSATAEMVQAASGPLLERLSSPEPESLGSVRELRTGTERTLELSGEASDFVSSMPAVVRGLARVALSPAAGAPLRSRMLAALINRWKDLVSGRRIWGPAAATTMIEGLRDLACHATSRPAEKLEVIRALGLRLADPPAMRAVAEVLAADRGSPELAVPAASAALALLGMRDSRGRMPEEDREHILWSLARILARSRIATDTPRTAKLRERIVEELFDGLNDGVSGTYELLYDLSRSEALPAELRKSVSDRLAARRTLAVRPRAD